MDEPMQSVAGEVKRRTLFDELQKLVGQIEKTERLVFGSPPKPVEEKPPTPAMSKVDTYIRIVKDVTEKLRGINLSLEAF